MLTAFNLGCEAPPAATTAPRADPEPERHNADAEQQQAHGPRIHLRLSVGVDHHPTRQQCLRRPRAVGVGSGLGDAHPLAELRDGHRAVAVGVHRRERPDLVDARILSRVDRAVAIDVDRVKQPLKHRIGGAEASAQQQREEAINAHAYALTGRARGASQHMPIRRRSK